MIDLIFRVFDFIVEKTYRIFILNALVYGGIIFTLIFGDSELRVYLLVFLLFGVFCSLYFLFLGRKDERNSKN